MDYPPKQCEEVDLAYRLLTELGHPQAVVEASDRPDVITQIGGLRIGIEVSQFHGDERPGAGGSALRAAEERLAKRLSGQPYVMWGNADPIPGLDARI